MEIFIETPKGPIAESEVAGRTPDHATLTIRGSGGARIVIDDLTEHDAHLVKTTIEAPA